MFWGILLTVIGVSLIVGEVFKIQVPIVQICVGIGFVYFGLSWIFGAFDISMKPGVTESAAVFGKGNFSISKDSSKDNEFSVVFGGGVVDLRNVDLSDGNAAVEVNTVFGETTVLVNEDTPYKIKADTVFGKSDLPQANRTVVGTQEYYSNNFDPKSNHLVISTNVVFGSLKITSDVSKASAEGKAASESSY